MKKTINSMLIIIIGFSFLGSNITNQVASEKIEVGTKAVQTIDQLVATCPTSINVAIDEAGNATSKTSGLGRVSVITHPVGKANAGIFAKASFVDQATAKASTTNDSLIKLIRANWLPSWAQEVGQPLVEHEQGEVKFNDPASKTKFEAGEAGCYRLDYYPDFVTNLYPDSHPDHAHALANQGFGIAVNVIVPDDSLGYMTSKSTMIKSDEKVIMTQGEAAKYATDIQDLLAPKEMVGAIEIRRANGTGPLGTDIWIYDSANTGHWFHGDQGTAGVSSGEIKFVTSKTDTTVNAIDEENFKNQKPGTYYVMASMFDVYSITEVVIPENTVNITFDGNVATSGGMMEDQIVELNTPTALSKNTFVKDGYTFTGWSTAVDGAVVYADGEVININSDVALTLYAKWELNDSIIEPSTPVVTPEVIEPIIPEDDKLTNTGIVMTTGMVMLTSLMGLLLYKRIK